MKVMKKNNKNRYNDNNKNNNNYRNSNNTSWRNKYCLLHGVTGHNGKDYNFKKEGHNDKATFKKKKSGSTAHCKNK